LRVTSLLNSPTREAAVEAQPSTTTSSASVSKWRFFVPILLLLGFAAHLAWRIWLIRYVPTVVAHADEDRYLLSARALTGGPGGFGNDTVAFRRLGYPVLLAPIYWYVQDPFKVFHYAQLIGAVISSLMFPLAYLFARRVLVAGRPLALAMAFVGAALPAVVYYSEFALTDVLFAPLGLAWLLLIHGWVGGRTNAGRFISASLAGVVVGYAYVIHVRGIVMLAIHLGLVAVIIVAKRGRTLWAVASAVTALLTTRLDWLLKTMLGDRLEHGGIEPDSKMLDAVTDALSFVRMVTDATGQIWYLWAATGGVGLVGLIVAYRAFKAPGDFALKTVYGVGIASTVLIALASAAALPEDGRVSNHVYFRYIAWLAPVWMMVGITALLGLERKAKFKLMFDAGLVMAVTLFVVLARMAVGEWFSPFDTPEVSFLANAWEEFRPFKAAIVAGAMLMLWLMRRWFIPMAAVLAVWAAAMVSINVNSIQPMVAKEYLPGSRLVHDLGVTPNDVVQTAAQVDLGSRLNHQREITWAPVTQFDAMTERPSSTATVVVAPWYPLYANRICEEEDTKKCSFVHWDGTDQGWTRVYTYDNEERQWALWRRSGESQAASDSERQLPKVR
jgi:hypothetical protein